jgi:hypothetical protein
MYEDNLGINTDCIFAVPVTDESEIVLYYASMKSPNA